MSRALAVLLLAAVAVEAAYLLARIWPFTTDDAYITLRYARHLAAGQGITWNLGEAPVEGYSNFLYVLIAALVFGFGGDPVPVLKLLGVAGLVASGVALFRLGRTWLPPAGAAVPVVLSAGYVGTLLWAVSGLETPVYQALVLLAIVLFGAAVGPRGRPAEAIGAGLCAGLLGLVRPEGPIVALVLGSILACRFAIESRAPIGTRIAGGRLLLLFAAPCAVVCLPYLAWRWAYFGDLLPNSVHCKADWPGDPWALIRDFWVLAGPYLLVGLIPLARRRDLRLLPLYLIPLAYGVILYDVDPTLGHYNRHFLAALPCVALLAVLGLYDLLRLSRLFGRNPRRDVLVAVPVAALSICWTVPAAETLESIAMSYADRSATRMRVGEHLRERLEPDGWYVVGDVGITAYLAGGNALDACCLTTRGLDFARSAADWHSQFADLVYRRSPQFLVINSRYGDVLAPVGGAFAELVARPEFSRDYARDTTISSADESLHYVIYRRPPRSAKARPLGPP